MTCTKWFAVTVYPVTGKVYFLFYSVMVYPVTGKVYFSKRPDGGRILTRLKTEHTHNELQ